MALKIGSIIL